MAWDGEVEVRDVSAGPWKSYSGRDLVTVIEVRRLRQHGS